MKRFALLLWPALVACATQLPDHVELSPSGEAVEIAVEPPSPRAYRLLGQVSGEAASKDPDAAQEAARNDLRNKAGEMGATLVTVDENTGGLVRFEEKTKVKLVGRAYKAID
jgi:hypothetical protein